MVALFRKRFGQDTSLTQSSGTASRMVPSTGSNYPPRHDGFLQNAPRHFIQPGPPRVVTDCRGPRDSIRLLQSRKARTGSPTRMTLPRLRDVAPAPPPRLSRGRGLSTRSFQSAAPPADNPCGFLTMRAIILGVGSEQDRSRRATVVVLKTALRRSIV